VTLAEIAEPGFLPAPESSQRDFVARG